MTTTTRNGGPRLDLFHQQQEAQGAAFWHPRGATLFLIGSNMFVFADGERS